VTLGVSGVSRNNALFVRLENNRWFHILNRN